MPTTICKPFVQYYALQTHGISGMMASAALAGRIICIRMRALTLLLLFYIIRQCADGSIGLNVYYIRVLRQINDPLKHGPHCGDVESRLHAAMCTKHKRLGRCVLYLLGIPLSELVAGGFSMEPSGHFPCIEHLCGADYRPCGGCRPTPMTGRYLPHVVLRLAYLSAGTHACPISTSVKSNTRHLALATRLAMGPCIRVHGHGPADWIASSRPIPPPRLQCSQYKLLSRPCFFPIILRIILLLLLSSSILPSDRLFVTVQCMSCAAHRHDCPQYWGHPDAIPESLED